MGLMVYPNKTNRFAFILLLCLFIATYFEYFFRGVNMIFWFILFFLAVISVSRNRGALNSSGIQTIYLYGIGTFFACLFQAFTNPSVSIIYSFGQVLLLSCFLLLAIATKESLLEKLVLLMTVIATYSIIIYAICSFFPPIKDYLVNDISSRFPSLGVEKAIQEGGGINFVIYNFQLASEYATLFRNCGPFWEPGMFAVFLDIALFVNIFILRGNRFVNIVLIVALLSTMSTGGYIGGLFIVFTYAILERKNVILSIVSVFLLVIFIYYFFETEFLGDKLLYQMTNTTIGDDSSRFGALQTHLKMFIDHPLWGHYGIEGYVIDDRRALASGLLIPLSSRGIFVGGLYYLLLYKASVNYSLFYSRSKRTGVFLFLFILLLSISQTILLTSCICVFIFAGLLLESNTNRYATV